MAAKKTKPKVIKSECCAPAMPGDYKPSLYLDLEGAKQVNQIEGLKLGEKVEILVTGIVRALEQRKSMRYRDGKEKEVETGHISVEGYQVQVLEEEKNAFTKMADEDDED